MYATRAKQGITPIFNVLVILNQNSITTLMFKVYLIL